MTQLAHVQSESAPTFHAGSTRGLVRWVCTSNPFYVLSALLVCLGLRISFGSSADAAQTWALLSGMAGYTLLLAVTACLLVRFVGVWDDVRTVLLLVVLMFLATSVTFDEVLARSPGRGVACYLGGLLFAVAVSEAMLRGIRLGLPTLFRMPYYLALALFFLYPVALTPLLDDPGGEALPWALFGFGPAAGLVCLTLLPAVRRGRAYVRDNGSPWPWAWYPWALFGVLAFGVVTRSAMLCWSMHHVGGAGSEPYLFGPYFLVPFLLPVGVLLLELGRVEGSKGALRTALFFPPVLLILATVGHRHEAVYEGFLTRFTTHLGGTPLYLTLLASVGFYGYAALKRVGMATEALAVSLAALAVVGPGTLDLGGLVSPRPMPILVVAALQLGLGLRRRESWRFLVGAFCLAVGATIGLAGTGISHPGPISFHLILAVILAVGAVYDDLLGRPLRLLGASMVVLACLPATSGHLEGSGSIPAWAIVLYPPTMAALIAGYGLVLGHRASWIAAWLILAVWLITGGWRGYLALRQLVLGLDYLALGMAAFALAVFVSVAKAGVLSGGATASGAKLLDTPEV